MNSDRRRDIATALLFILLGLAAIFYLIPQGVTVPSTEAIPALSPDFWPRIIAYGSIAAAIFLLVETLTMQQPKIEEDAGGEADAVKYQLSPLPSTLRILVLIAALFGFYASLTTLGVVAASILLLVAMMLFFGERKWWLIASVSFGVPVLLYLFFRYVASVPIPLGLFEN